MTDDDEILLEIGRAAWSREDYRARFIMELDVILAQIEDLHRRCLECCAEIDAAIGRE
jgi:hypothetical protein